MAHACTEAASFSCLVFALYYSCSLADGNPYVFLGDFNIKPSDPIYSLITEGNAERTDNLPRAISYEGWTSKVPEPMKSAYVEATSREPDFTNFSILPHQKVRTPLLQYSLRSLYSPPNCQITRCHLMSFLVGCTAVQKLSDSGALPFRNFLFPHLRNISLSTFCTISSCRKIARR